MVEQKSKSQEFYIATITVELSQRTFLDFVRTGGSSNYLPEFQNRLTKFQEKLEVIADRRVRLRELSSLSDGDLVGLDNFRITTLTYSEGSVVAKIQLACTIGFGAPFAVVQALAAYPEAKDGFQELRSDLIEIAKGIFDDNPDGGHQELSSVSYYFLKPETAEKNLRELAEKDRENRLDNDEADFVQQTN